jgi:hypothetical protein
MNRLACVIAIAAWYLVYPPAIEQSDSEPRASLSKWEIDSSYGSAADCFAAYHSDVDSMLALKQSSRDFLQTQAGRCIASDDLRLAK